jgi:hypothetical protein
MSLEKPHHGSQQSSGFRIKPGHREGIAAAVFVPPINHRRVWLCAIFSGLLAALIGWVAGERANRLFHWEGRVQVEEGDGRNQRERSPARVLLESRSNAEAKNTSLAMGILGAVLGLTLGAGGGLARRSPRAAAVSGLTGFLLGAAVGTAMPLQLVPLFYRSVCRPPNPAFPLLIHTSVYALIGGVGGLAFGLGLSGPGGAAKGLLGGAMGAILGAIIYNVVHTITFPLEWDLSPMPGQGVSRLLAHLCVALTTTACVVLATDERVQTRRRGKALAEQDS